MRAQSWQQTLPAHSFDALADLPHGGGVACCEPLFDVRLLQCRDAAAADAVNDGVNDALRCCETTWMVQHIPQRVHRHPIPIFWEVAHHCAAWHKPLPLPSGRAKATLASACHNPLSSWWSGGSRTLGVADFQGPDAATCTAPMKMQTPPSTGRR